MRNVMTRSHVGKDGMLKLEIPTNLEDKDVEVVVIFQPAEDEHKKPTPEELGWPPGFFDRIIGGWQGEPLVREPQGEYETREELK